MENQYERKLELIRAIREENRSNIARMNHRESILYGCTSKQSEKTSYQSGGYGVKPVESVTEEAELAFFKPGSSFLFRSFVAVALVMLFMGLKMEKIDPFLGVTDKKIENLVKEDFSKMVVDYMKDFTYTLDYEKTSIK